jgi:hypothetical protein
VDAATKGGAPDLIANIPSLQTMYKLAFQLEVQNSLSKLFPSGPGSEGGGSGGGGGGGSAVVMDRQAARAVVAAL